MDDKQVVINSISTLTNTLSLLFSMDETDDCKVVKDKILELVDKL